MSLEEQIKQARERTHKNMWFYGIPMPQEWSIPAEEIEPPPLMEGFEPEIAELIRATEQVCITRRYSKDLKAALYALAKATGRLKGYRIS